MISSRNWVLLRSFKGELDFGHGLVRTVRDFCVFHRHGANEPSGEKTAWVLRLVRASGLCPDLAALDFALGRRVFRGDIFEKANQLRNSTSPYHERKSNPEIAFA